MTRLSHLAATPPYAIEAALRQFGKNLRTARLRRNLTIQQVAEKIGTGVRAVADAEKGKLTTGIGTYTALLWVYDLLTPFSALADPTLDREGLQLMRQKERARQPNDEMDNDF